MPNRATEVTMDLPIGQDYLWFQDINVVGLSSRLNNAGRQCAIAAFREDCLAESRYGSTPTIPPQRQQHVTVHVTVPITTLPAPYTYSDNRTPAPM